MAFALACSGTRARVGKKGRYIVTADFIDYLPDFLFRPFPSRSVEQFRTGFLIEAPARHLCRIAGHYRVEGYILTDDCAIGDHRAMPNGYTREKVQFAHSQISLPTATSPRVPPKSWMCSASGRYAGKG